MTVDDVEDALLSVQEARLQRARVLSQLLTRDRMRRYRERRRLTHAGDDADERSDSEVALTQLFATASRLLV
jgi:hypothetical protein